MLMLPLIWPAENSVGVLTSMMVLFPDLMISSIFFIVVIGIKDSETSWGGWEQMLDKGLCQGLQRRNLTVFKLNPSFFHLLREFAFDFPAMAVFLMFEVPLHPLFKGWILWHFMFEMPLLVDA
jgi:hypothetical protein